MRAALALLLLGVFAGCPRTPPTELESRAASGGARARLRPPMAKRIDYRHSTHGQTREDPYFWLRDDERENTEVLDYLRRENEYTEQELAPLSGFRETLYEEIVARIPQDDASVPVQVDGWWRYTRNETGKEYDIHCRLPASAPEPDPSAGPATGEEIVLDENERARGHDYYAAVGPMISVDGATMAFGEDTVSRRIYTLRFKDLGTGELLPDTIEGTTGGAVWALDHRTVFYVKREEGTLRAHQVWRHTLGETEDTLVFEETDEQFYVSVGRSRSRDYILIGSYQTVSSEYRFVDARQPTAAPQLFLERERDHEYDVDHLGGRFYVRTNWEAQDFRLMSAAPADTGHKDRWREEIPAREGVLFRGFELFRDYLVASERVDGIAGLRVLPWGDEGRADAERAHRIAFDEPVYYATLGDNPEVGSDTLRLIYSSMTTPWSTVDYRMDTKARVLKKRQRVVGSFEPDAYATERLMATARDGTPVPISLVYRRDLDRSEPQPLLLYAYGSYGHSMDPTFSSVRLSLLDRGFVYAIAHVRGGQEMGRAWYEDGKLMKKLNTFFDYIDCGRHLVDQGWTASDRLFGHGGSAGGLLIGAVANMAPDLFEGLVADVPFVDVVTTMLDETIPLTTFEYDEWGNPNAPAAYEYMMRYSPYDNVRAQAYPAMLVISGLHDSQVQYWEPAKWVARLRHRKTDDNRLLLHMNMEAGHGGASGRFRQHRETALTYAFILDLVGIHE